MAWFRRKKTVEDREPSPERENGDNGSVTSAQTGTTGKRKFKDRFQNKNRWYWKFVQQRLPGWAPILTANGVVAYFFGMCLLCIAIGVPVLIASLNIQQYSTRYDSVPPFNTNRQGFYQQ